MAEGCVWKGACMVEGCVRQGACVAGGVHVRGASMAGGMHDRVCAWRGGEHVWQERQPLQRVVRILLECILVVHNYYHVTLFRSTMKTYVRSVLEISTDKPL